MWPTKAGDIRLPTQATKQADLAGRSKALPVGDVVEIVREWVDLHARHLPDFAGAYLWGGITALPADAPFQLYRDVDVHVVVTSSTHAETQEILYRGLMLEVDSVNLEAHQDAEAALADPSHAPNMATTQILVDPTGMLTQLQQAVAAGYRQRRWIQARCEAEKVSAEKQLVAMRQVPDSTAGQDPLWPVWGLLNALSGLLAVAQLKRPTTRRTLSLLGELLDEQGRSDLHEAALAVWGSAHMTQADVRAMLHQSVIAFDRSVEVYQTPTPFGFTIRAHLRPYLTEATQEMIDEGNHREATFWIMTLVTESYLVLQNDAPDAEKPVFAAQLQAMLGELGYTSAEAWAERVAGAERLAQDIYSIADGLVVLHPE
jgi:hypothetical protein